MMTLPYAGSFLVSGRWITALLALSLISCAPSNAYLEAGGAGFAAAVACQGTGVQGCPTLASSIADFKAGNKKPALRRFGKWMQLNGYGPHDFDALLPVLKPIAAADPQSALLFAEVARHLNAMPPAPTPAPTPPSPKPAVAQTAVVVAAVPPPAPVVAPAAVQRDANGLIPVAEYQAMKKAGELQAVSRGAGFLFLEFTPSTATVSVAGRKHTGSPITLEDVKAGYRRVEISQPGYSTIEGYVLIERLKVARVTSSLEQAHGSLTILSDPPAATVLVDGVARGKAPLTIEQLSGGRHVIALTAPGRSWSGEVIINGGTRVVRASLSAVPGGAAAVVQPRRAASVVVAAPPPQPKPQPVARAAAKPAAALAPPPRAPAARPASRGKAVDLRSLSPSLRAMAWQNLSGKQIEVELSNGVRALVKVGDVAEDRVVLIPAGERGRWIPMDHVASVRE